MFDTHFSLHFAAEQKNIKTHNFQAASSSNSPPGVKHLTEQVTSAKFPRENFSFRNIGMSIFDMKSTKLSKKNASAETNTLKKKYPALETEFLDPSPKHTRCQNAFDMEGASTVNLHEVEDEVIASLTTTLIKRHDLVELVEKLI